MGGSDVRRPDSSAGGPAVRRRPWGDDAPTVLINLQMALMACYLMGLGALLVFIRGELGLSLTMVGAIGSVSAMAGVAGSWLAPRLAARRGRSAVISAAVATCCGGLLTLTAASAFPPRLTVIVTMVAVASTTLAGFVWTILASAYLLEHHGRRGPASLTAANAWAAFGGTAMPLLLGVLAGTALGWRSGVIAVVVGMVAVEAARRRLPESFGRMSGIAAGRVQMPRRYWWGLAGVVLGSQAEFTLAFWGAEFARERTDIGLAGAAAMIGAVNGGILLGRAVVARLADRFAVDVLLRSSLLVTIAAFTLLWTTRSPVVAAVAMVACGVGLAANWPLGCSRMVAIVGGHSDRVLGTTFLANALSAGIAPFALGVLAERVGIHGAFLVVPVLCAGAIAIIVAVPTPRAHVVPPTVVLPG